MVERFGIVSSLLTSIMLFRVARPGPLATDDGHRYCATPPLFPMADGIAHHVESNRFFVATIHERTRVRSG